jgi:hypothetical protein
MNTPKFYYTKKLLRKMKVMGKKCKMISYQDISFTEKPDSGDNEKRIDPHSLFSMFTANMIKEKVNWYR